MKKRLCAVFIIMTLLVSCFTSMAFGASGTKKMTYYGEVIKKGNTAYCNAKIGIYKVNLKTGKVKALKEYDPEGAVHFGQSAGCMKLYKGYLYYTDGAGIGIALNRVKVSGKSKPQDLLKHIDFTVSAFAISKGKIYLEGTYMDSGKAVKRVMKLNGRNIKKSKFKITNTYKLTNKKGYKIQTVSSGGKGTDYLVTPAGKKIKLCSYDNEPW